MKPCKVSVRTCTACRTSGDKRNLLRVVRTAAGAILVDPTGKIPGRGVYLCASRDCLKKAIKEKRLSRALRAEIPEETIRKIEETVEQGSEEM